MVFDDFAVLVLLGLDQCIELGVVHKHLLLDLCECDQDFLLEVLSLAQSVIHQLLHPVHFDEELRVYNLLMPQIQESLLQCFEDAGEGTFDLLDRLAVVISAQLNLELFPYQK